MPVVTEDLDDDVRAGEAKVDTYETALGVRQHLLRVGSRQPAIGADLEKAPFEPGVSAPRRLGAVDDREELGNAVTAT